MNSFVYLPGIDRVIFLDHIEQIEVFRDSSEVKSLGVYVPTKPCMVKHPLDIKVLCHYFMIPLVKKDRLLEA